MDFHCVWNNAKKPVHTVSFLWAWQAAWSVSCVSSLWSRPNRMVLWTRWTLLCWLWLLRSYFCWFTRRYLTFLHCTRNQEPTNNRLPQTQSSGRRMPTQVQIHQEDQVLPQVSLPREDCSVLPWRSRHCYFGLEADTGSCRLSKIWSHWIFLPIYNSNPPSRS